MSNDFARRLRALRQSRGLTQRQLAGDALSVSYVSLLESGRRSPTADTVRALATALDCSPAELAGEESTPASRPPALNVRFGQLALEAGRLDEAREHFERALGVPDLDPLLRSEAVIGIARVLEAQGHLERAAKAYESLVQEAIDAPSYLASLSVVKSWCRCLYELGELDRVTEVGMGAIQQLDRLQAWHSDLAIELLSTVAAAYFELGDVGQADRLLQEGLERAEQMGSARARAAILWNASHLASERGRHREALELAEEALAYYRHGSDRRSAARLLIAYGHLLLDQDPPRPSEAREVLEQALRDLAESGLGYDRGYVLTALARAHLMLGDAGAAVRSAERSLEELGPEAALERSRASSALAAGYAAQGNLEKARELFASAAYTLGQLKASRHAGRAWVELGNTLAAAGEATAAVEAFRKATASVHLGGPAAGTPARAARPIERRADA